MFLRSKVAVVGASLYILVFIAASLYPLFSREMFAGLPAVMLAWPWIDYWPPSSVFLLIACPLLNAVLIYIFLAILSFVLSWFPRRT
jgi:hypothetical protein